MPVYEFKCKDCSHVFEELRKIGDFDSATCPECKSVNTEKVFSLFAGSEKSCGSCAPSTGG